MTETHLSSLVIHARPDRLEEVGALIESLGCEIHATSPQGKLVVTIETSGIANLADTVTRLQLLDGVFAATLVFHHIDDGADEAGRQDTLMEDTA